MGGIRHLKPTAGCKMSTSTRKMEGGGSMNISCQIPDAKFMPSWGLNQRYSAAPVVFQGDFDGGEHVYRRSSSYKCSIAIGDRSGDNTGQGRTRM